MVMELFSVKRLRKRMGDGWVCSADPRRGLKRPGWAGWDGLEGGVRQEGPQTARPSCPDASPGAGGQKTIPSPKREDTWGLLEVACRCPSEKLGGRG